MPVVVVKDEPEAETKAVRAEVVMADELAAPAYIVVMPVVVVKDEPEAETRAVRAEVVMADELAPTLSVMDFNPASPQKTHVTVAVVDALPLAADERTDRAEAVTDADPEAVEEYADRALAQYVVPNVITVCASEVFGHAWFAQSRIP
ncbi:hypothetical protein LTR85_006414 [Meristemomyces frigidus]|nr:hypothetical protein LTR85_006414 [Meristemomyces frigidus]